MYHDQDQDHEIFNHVYVINLAKDTERLAKIDSNLKQYGINYHKVNAIYGKEALADPKMSKNITTMCKIFCSYGIIGCYLSHSMLWEKLAKDDSAEYYIVLEDDARFTDDTKNVIVQALRKHPTTFDLLSLFTFNDHLSIACFEQPITDDGKYKMCRNPLMLSTLGYIISKKGAQRLLDIVGKRAKYHIDFVLNWNQQKGVRYFVTSPNVIVNDGFFDSNLLGDNITVTSEADWGMKAIVFSLFQSINIRNGHIIPLCVMIIAFMLFRNFWWIKLPALVIGTVAILTTPF